MKMRYLNVIRRAGNAKATGNAYDMHAVTVCVPLNCGTFGKDPARAMTVSGFGDDTATIDVELEAIPAFKDISPYTMLEFTTDQKFVMGELKTVITGFKPISAISKVA